MYRRPCRYIYVSMGSKANACAPLKRKKAERLQAGCKNGGSGWEVPLGVLGVVKYDVATPSGATNKHTLTDTHALSGAPTLYPPNFYFIFPFCSFLVPSTHALDTWRYRRFRCVRPHLPNPSTAAHPASFEVFQQAWQASPRRLKKPKERHK